MTMPSLTIKKIKIQLEACNLSVENAKNRSFAAAQLLAWILEVYETATSRTIESEQTIIEAKFDEEESPELLRSPEFAKRHRSEELEQAMSPQQIAKDIAEQVSKRDNEQF